MTRTTIMADPALLEKLRRIAQREGISLAQTIRQAMLLRVKPPRVKPRFIGAGASKKWPNDTAERSGDLTFAPRSWR
jgi:hypothetical protein